MSCSSSCCQSKAANSERMENKGCNSTSTNTTSDDSPITENVTENPRSSCCLPSELDVDLPKNGDCCLHPGKNTIAQGGGIYHPAEKPEAANDRQDNCCGDDSFVDDMSEDNCCSSHEKPSLDLKQASGCNNDPKKKESNPRVEQADMETQPSSCCEGKKRPCCDDSCIERLAIRACNEKCNNQIIEEDCCGGGRCEEARGSDQMSNIKPKPCEYHEKSTRERYSAVLKKIGCICRGLIARNEPSCCESSPGSTLEKKRATIYGARVTPLLEKSRFQQRTISTEISESCYDNTSKGFYSSGDLSIIKESQQLCGQACCSPSEKTPLARREEIDQSPPDNKSCCVTNTCNPSGPRSCNLGSSEPNCQTLRDEITSANLENGLGRPKRVVLSVSGMTCVGCETKLQRALQTIKSIQNLKTSLVLCRAEFDLDLRYDSVDSVVQQLQRMTEFKIEEIKTEGSQIEVQPPMDIQHFINQDLPLGVSGMNIVDKTHVAISFDPKVIGARDLLERSFNSVLQLAPPKPDPSLSAGSKHVRHVGIMTIFSILLTIPVLVLAWTPHLGSPITNGAVSLALATLVQVLIAGPFYGTALKSLIFSRMIEMDLLIVLSTTAAYVFSVVSFGYLVSGSPLATGEFFETSTLLVTLIMVGRFVSALARQKAIESISVRSLQVSTAYLVDEKSNHRDEIDVRLLQHGDSFWVAPETRVPTDGTIIAGFTEVDESTITGESELVEKRPGSVVVAGSVNGSGAITVRLSRLPENNTISTIAGMVDEAKLSRPRIQTLANRVASYFVPIAMLLSIITFIVWIPIGIHVRQQTGSRAVTVALTYAITVIIVSCPCAIGLAVPMVIVIAGGVAAKQGVIFKTADTIELARRASHVVFDKTGTLTQGKLSVISAKYVHGDPQVVASTILGLVSNVKHPVSIAVGRYLEAQGVTPSQFERIKTEIGRGVEGTMNGKIVRAGNSRWLRLESHPEVQSLLSQGHTTFCVTVEDELCAFFTLKDSLRPGALSTVTELRKRGIAVSIVSGDDHGPVQDIAQQLGITDFRSKCSPSDKQEYMKQATMDLNAVTIFCGDGTNDAVALAQATIGVHMNVGTDVAQSAADVVLVRSSLDGILLLIDLSKASFRRIQFNFIWSFIYNTIAILLATGAFVKARIPPEFAGLGELVSVLPVIAIALQLRWAKFIVF